MLRHHCRAVHLENPVETLPEMTSWELRARWGEVGMLRHHSRAMRLENPVETLPGMTSWELRASMTSNPVLILGVRPGSAPSQ